jgi:hypothetical protein
MMIFTVSLHSSSTEIYYVLYYTFCFICLYKCYFFLAHGAHREGSRDEEVVFYYSYLSLIAIPVSIAHILFFGVNLADVKSNNYLWRLGIIYSHAILVLFFTLSFFTIHRIRIGKLSPQTMSMFTPFIHLLLIGAGAAIAAIDQLVTDAITPFLVVCTITSFMLFTPPILSALFCLIGYLIFFNLLSFTQLNEAILLSNRVNGITITGLGFGISYILWGMAMSNFRQIGRHPHKPGDRQHRGEFGNSGCL